MRENYENQKEGLWIQFENTGLHLDRIENFDISYHRSVYKTAMQKLEEIIENFEENKNKNNELINILAFIGERGSGKSSAMKSFIDAISDLRHSMLTGRLSEEYVNYFQNHSIGFTCLDYIDGALLEQGEDIVSLVLAQIYQKFVDVEQTRGLYTQEDYEYKKREVLKKLESVYKTVCEIQALNHSDGIPNVGAISYLSKLDSLASSQKVKKEFQSLVHNFTDWMQYYETGRIEQKTEHYLVIAIDDIDLNIENGFSMLEKIHRYLMVKNVIVVLSVDYQQMHKLAVRHFYQMYPPVDAVLRNGAAYASRIATDYLDKILPMNYRIYISDINDRYVNEQTGVIHEQAGIKEALLGKIYRRTGVGFDTQGMKPHFYVKGSLRHINNLYLLLESMSPVDMPKLYMHLKSEKIIPGISKKIVHNWNLMLQDLMDRMAIDKLSFYPEASEETGKINKMNGLYSNTEQFLNTIASMDLERAKEEVVTLSRSLSWRYGLLEMFIEEYSEDLPEDLINKMLEEPEEEPIKKCTYGDLVEAIYNLGRLGNNKYKPLVHCLLAYFSYMFTREYLLETKQFPLPDQTQVVRAGRMKKLINGSIVEEWGKSLLPACVLKNESTVDIEEDGRKKVIKSDDIVYFGNREQISLRKVFVFNLTNLNITSVDDVAEIICDIEALYLLCSDIIAPPYTQEKLIENMDFFSAKGRYQYFWFDFQFKNANTEEIENTYEHSLEESTLTFNILNFAANYYNMSERLALLEKGLVKGMIPYCKTLTEGQQENDCEIKRKIEVCLQRYSLRQDYENWEMTYGKNAMPFPLQWFDMSYNILKRTRRHAKSKFPQAIKFTELDKMFDYIKNIYKYMSQELQKQYEALHTEKGGGYNFAEQFIFFPIIKYFMEEELNDIEKIIPENKRQLRRRFWGDFFRNNTTDERIESKRNFSRNNTTDEQIESRENNW